MISLISIVNSPRNKNGSAGLGAAARHAELNLSRPGGCHVAGAGSGFNGIFMAQIIPYIYTAKIFCSPRKFLTIFFLGVFGDLAVQL
jgi:hypothetical protein